MNSCQARMEQAYDPHIVGRRRKRGAQGQPWYAASWGAAGASETDLKKFDPRISY